MSLLEARAGVQKLQRDDWLAEVKWRHGCTESLSSAKQEKKIMRIRQLPLFRRRVSPICPYNSRYKGLQSATACSLKRLLQKVSLNALFRLSGNHAEETLSEKEKKKKKSSNKHLAETVREVSFATAAGFPAPHLKSHINHRLFETDLNQRVTHFRRPETER